MKRISALLFGWCVSAAAVANAQTGWRPRAVDLNPEMTGANRAAAIARLEAIERIFQHVPELAHPNGFEIQPRFIGDASRSQGQGESLQPGNVLEYRLILYFFPPGRLQSSGDITVMVNSPGDRGAWHDEQGRYLYPEPWRVDRVPFATEAYGRSKTGQESTGLSPTEASYVKLWFTSGGELPWRTVTREEYFKARIFENEGTNGEKLAEQRKLADKGPYQLWLDEAPKRKKEREELLSTLAKLQSAADVAKLRKELEDGEREAGEAFKKSDSSDRENAKKPIESNDSLRAQLNRMTPAQRKMPTILDYNSEAYRRTGVYLRDRDTVAQGISRLLTPNYDFWRARRSPVEVRDIEVAISAIAGCCDPPPPPIHNALWQTYKKLDWRALAALLDQPTRP